jgi:hypothetical protein
LQFKCSTVAFDYAQVKNISNRFNQEAQIAGKDWCRSFIRRHKLALRKPEPTSLNRVMGFNKTAVSAFFSNLKQLIDQYKFKGNRIFNIDESGISTVHDPPRVISSKGKKQFVKLTSAERGTLTTVICGMSAQGQFVPPMIIFARKRRNDLLMQGAPENSIQYNTGNGWADQEGFLTFLRHFIKYTHPSPDDPVLLWMDTIATNL